MSSKQDKKKESKGLVYVFTGDGKGKTSAAIGGGVRAALIGKSVAMVCWYKSKDWDVSEYRLPKNIRNFKIYVLGKGFFIKDSRFKLADTEIKITPLTGGGSVVDRSTRQGHIKSAKAALKKASELIVKVDVLILDEVNSAIADGLIDLIDLVDLISKRGKVHLILTGRNADEKIIEMADLVTEMKKVKHPYDKGVKAVRGLDF